MTIMLHNKQFQNLIDLKQQTFLLLSQICWWTMAWPNLAELSGAGLEPKLWIKFLSALHSFQESWLKEQQLPRVSSSHSRGWECTRPRQAMQAHLKAPLAYPMSSPLTFHWSKNVLGPSPISEDMYAMPRVGGMHKQHKACTFKSITSWS